MREDGVYLGIYAKCNYGTGVRIFVYINNPKNRDAILGKDVFVFVIYSSDNNIVKAWGQGHTREDLKAAGSMPNSNTAKELPNAGSCNRQGFYFSYARAGAACSALIMLDGWKIRSDYPW